MHMDVERAAIRVLTEHAAPSLSLRELHALVVAEVGPGTGTYARFRDDIGRRRDVFAVVVPADPLVEATRWPVPVQAEYRRALHAAGLDAEPRVLLVRARAQRRPGTGFRAVDTDVGHVAPRPALLGQLGSSLLELLERAGTDASLAALVGAAMADATGLPRALDSQPEGAVAHEPISPQPGETSPPTSPRPDPRRTA